MAEALPFQLTYQGAGPLDARSVVTDTSESELSTYIQNDSTAFAGQPLWLTDESAAYVVTDADAGLWRRYDGPRVVSGVTEGGDSGGIEALADWLQGDEQAYKGERLWLSAESATYVVLDTSTGAWRKVGGHRVVENTPQDELTSHLSQDDSFYDGQVIWLADEGGAYVITDATNGYWRRYDRPRPVGGVSQVNLSEWIQDSDTVYDGAHLWLPAEGNEYVVIDATNGIWRPTTGPRIIESDQFTESDLQYAISNGDSYYEGQTLWVANEKNLYVVTNAANGDWRRLAGRLIINGTGESSFSTYIQNNASALSNGQIVWLAPEKETYLIRDVGSGRWRRLGGLPVVTGTSESGLTSLIGSSDRFEDGQRIWLADESSLYVVLDTATGAWRRLAEPTDSRVVVSSQDVTVTPEDEGRLFVIDTFTAENDGYGSPRTLNLPGDAVGEGWEIRVLLDGDMHLEVVPGSNATLAGTGTYISEMAREYRIVCRSSGTYRVEGLRRGLNLRTVATTYKTGLDRGYELDGPVPQIDTAYIPRSGQLWLTKHGSKSSDTRSGSVFVVGINQDTDYEITSEFGMPVTMCYHPIADRIVTFDADARDAVIFDPTTYPSSQPASQRTGTVSTISVSDDLYPLTSEWIGTDTVVVLLLEPSAPELVEFRVDIGAGTKSESSTTSVGAVDSDFYREPRRSVVDRQRGYVYLVADAATYVVDPSDWLTPLVSIDLDLPSNNPDFWNGVYSRVDDRIYLFESGYVDSTVEPSSQGGGVAGTVAAVDPHRWALEDTYELQIEGGESLVYIGPLDCIVGCPAEYGNLEVYSPELRQSLQRKTDDEVPGAAAHLSFKNEVAYVNQSSIIAYSY
jgi:hypothetical protein